MGDLEGLLPASGLTKGMSSIHITRREPPKKINAKTFWGKD